MTIFSNKAMNNIYKHIQSMMKVSSKYGKSMGNMGALPFNSAQGSDFAKNAAQMLGSHPNLRGPMLKQIMNKATASNMSPDHMKRMKELQSYIMAESGLSKSSDLGQSIYNQGLTSEFKNSLQSLGFM